MIKECYALKRPVKAFRIAGIVLLAVGFLTAAGIFCSASKEKTIGIIGGADGPTLIFLASRLKFTVLLGVTAFIAAIGCFIISAVIKKKNKGGKNGT